VIEVKRELNLTQEELASLIGTQKSNISRLESGNYNSTLEFLSKLAK
jgi:transcriptional regulator with XRE-family HTH domain